jgi:hypothetical protein
VGLSKEWWDETISTAYHIINRISTKNK